MDKGHRQGREVGMVTLMRDETTIVTGRIILLLLLGVWVLGDQG